MPNAQVYLAARGLIEPIKQEEKAKKTPKTVTFADLLKPNKLDSAIAKVKIPSIKPKVQKTAKPKLQISTVTPKTEEIDSAASIVSATAARMKLTEIE